ncbi:lytic murein transglycosylase [Candidatus Solirubrobacter pratensis]|uniref:lytic murein transglycosylase n=1 Tax=Candidatus Solirubrobacter pratensis TaxID=1298857 RepID=UPI0018C951D6|nr:lytic murein transglycosylase [Candidatus Solirubrobacter pratensis]
MTRRILATAFASATVFVAVLGVPALSDDPTPTPSPDNSATQTPEATATAAPTQAPTETATEARTQAPTQAPTEAPTQAPATDTPEADPTSTPTQAPTETPFPSPVDTTIPTSDATGTAATATPTPTATPARKAARPANVSSPKKGQARVCGGGDQASTSASGCVKAPEKVKTVPAPALTNHDGSPAPSNPSYALSIPGPAKVGVPNFFIDKFRIPPFLLPIYQAAGMQYGIRWEVLAGINEIETDYGRNLNISSAGALGWMQFMPSTWKQYGVDANQDGVKDPFNPVDAIFAAARYLKAAGGDKDLRRAIFAYNHADWYVDSVLMRAQVIGGIPGDLVGSLTGLTQGRFPVRAKATYAGALTKADRKRKGSNPAITVESKAGRKGIEIFAKAGSPVIAVNDGKVTKLGRTKRLGRYLVLQDVYGNSYTYAHLKTVAKTYPSPKPRKATAQKKASKRRGLVHAPSAPPVQPAATPAAATAKVRLFAHPERTKARDAGGEAQLSDAGASAGAPLGLDPKDFRAKPLVKGAPVLGGTTLGRIGTQPGGKAPHLLFEIRPAGRGAPRIDPKPILDGWKLLESTAIYRAKGKNALLANEGEELSIGQIMLMSKQALSKRVLEDQRIDIYSCGRADIRAGAIDRRVLATLEYLAVSGLKPTVSSLECGHGLMTTSGNVSEHTTGTAVDIAAVNGIPIYGHQGPNSIADVTIQRLLTLQGTMKPHQIISLMTFKGADNTLAMADHDDHIHVGWRPLYGDNKQAARQIDAILKPKQWIKLIDRLGEIDNPKVAAQPSKYAVKDKPREAAAGSGD